MSEQDQIRNSIRTVLRKAIDVTKKHPVDLKLKLYSIAKDGLSIANLGPLVASELFFSKATATVNKNSILQALERMIDDGEVDWFDCGRGDIRYRFLTTHEKELQAEFVRQDRHLKGLVNWLSDASVGAKISNGKILVCAKDLAELIGLSDEVLAEYAPDITIPGSGASLQGGVDSQK